MDFLNNNYLALFAINILIVGFSVIVLMKNLTRIREVTVKLTKKTTSEIDDKILNKDLIGRAILFIPIIIVSITSTVMDLGEYAPIMDKLISISIPVVLLLVIFSLSNAINEIYKDKDIYKKIPFFAGIQLIKIISLIVVVIVVVATIIGKSPLIILSGLGAATAILMLIFKDVITGFVSGIHLVTNNMLSKGDWITMPSKGVDGDVIEIGISTVKVRNFDKTITSVPAQQLTGNVFFNWTGMQQSGGRRIKRNILIDANSISFMDEESTKELSKIGILETYLSDKTSQVSTTNEGKDEFIGDRRNLTNIGTYRAYIKEYLRSRDDIHKENFTFLVRQLESTEHGVPIQLYVFTNTVNWIDYEEIQSDIFDHLLSMAPVFNLKIYQRDNG
jgi:miniconductance mechanosensitive channel